MADGTGKITKIYKIIDPKSYQTVVPDSQNTVGDGGSFYGNYSWFNKLVSGSSARMQRYREFDMMDEDTDVSRALDIIKEEIIGNRPKQELPFELKITAGNEQQVSASSVVTIRAALKTWCNIQSWNRRLPSLVRNTIKYGDTFFKRPKDEGKPLIFIHPKNVTNAIVSKEDVSDVRGWQIKTNFEETKGGGSGFFNTMGSDAYVTHDFKADQVVRFGLHDDMSDEAPFSQSILRAAYKTFKQKQLLEDSVLIYRIQRAPEKRVFKLEVGNTPNQQVAQILSNAKNEIKQSKVPSSYGSNQIDSIYSPTSMNEDFYFATRKGIGSTVETLPAGQGLGELKELDYFYNKMFRAMRIPQSYMDNTTEGGSPFNDGKVGIAYQQEIKFTLYIESLQVYFEDVFDKEFKRFLRSQKINVDPTVFKIVLPAPSNFKKSRDQDVNQQSLNILNTALGVEGMSVRFAYEKFGDMTKEEILINEFMKAEELGLDPNAGKKNYAKIYAPDNADSGGYDGGMTDGAGLPDAGGSSTGADDGTADDLDLGNAEPDSTTNTTSDTGNASGENAT